VICDKNAVNKKLSPSELTTLLTTVETKMAHFAKNMKAFGDGITLREKSICILIKLGFHSKDIAILMGISQQSLSNIKKRLLLELFNIDGRANELNERLCMDW
jgi:DNA-binding CsgD family transcriptional regulator